MSEEDRYVVEELCGHLLNYARERSKQWEMLISVTNNVNEWSVRKCNRWIGYAQCLMVASGELTLDEIMNSTRQIEQEAKERYG